MLRKSEIEILVLILIFVVGVESKFSQNDKSSLVFVFDTTGSMYNDLKQLREGAEMILKTALEESNVIEDFVFVPFHDPAVGPATVTKNKDVFKSALKIVRVYGGGDCPEKSLGGIQLALNVSRPRSYIYVFTDATARDHKMVYQVLDLVQRRQSQVVFVLTGHCNDLHKPSYKVYHQIAAASSGQVFNLNKTSVHKVLDFVRSSIKGRTVNLGSVVNPPGYNKSQGIPVDSSVGEVTVSVSGAKPQIKVVDPQGEELTGPPKLVTTLDLAEIMVVKVLQPEPGNWTITTGSEENHSVKVVGLSNLTFNHGFSVETPRSAAETSYRPLQGTYNHMLISLTQTDKKVDVNYAEILTLDGNMLFEVTLKPFDRERKIYISDPFVPPDEFFYIAINGRDEYNQELRRVGATAVQSKPPEIPYLTAPRRVKARAHERVVLTCDVESLVPLTAMWTKDASRIQQQVSSLQSTSIDYEIGDMGEGDVGTYRCVAKNVAGLSKWQTDVVLIVDPPQITISPYNKTVEIGDNVTISCTVTSESLLLRAQIISKHDHAISFDLNPNINGIYTFNTTFPNIAENGTGFYSCVAANRGGHSTQSTYISVQSMPTAQILGPHTVPKPIHSSIQLVCHVENAHKVVWMKSGVVRDVAVNGSANDVLEVSEIEDGVWECVAVRGEYRASDSVEIFMLIKPKVSIQGPKRISVANGTKHEVVCFVEAKPEPRIVWHKETERFLNNTITLSKPNIYKSVLTLDSRKEVVNGTYFCFGENSEGIHQDSIIVDVRRNMTLIEGFTDKMVELYSQIDFICNIDSIPSPTITWHHNGTALDITNNLQLSSDNKTLYIGKVDFCDLGSYSCVGDNGFDRMSVEGTLQVIGLESPAVSKEPQQIITLRGNATRITCRVLKGKPEVTVTWQYHNSDSLHYTTLPRNVVENNTELLIPVTDVHNAGVYRCVAENVLGKDVYEVSLVVQYAPQLVEDASKEPDKPLEIKAGEKVTFSCKATGIPPPVVVWTKDFSPISFSSNVYLTDSNDLVIDRTTEYDSGLFTCNATSVLGSLLKNFTLIVYIPPIISSPTTDPELELLEGQLVELPCSGTGVPKPEIQWLQNGELITDHRKHADEFGLRFVANLTDFGEYTCIVKNQYGNESYSFSLYIWVPPYILPPLEVKKDVLLRSNATLECSAVGFPIPNIIWMFQDDIVVENTTEFSFNDMGSAFVNNASYTQEGYYTCIAENVAGVAKKVIYLNVNEPPKILEENYTGPYIATNKDIALAMACRTTGKPKPYVVWSKDGFYLDNDSRYDVDVDGTLAVKKPSEELSGLYTCVAKNKVGETNRTVSLEVYTLPNQTLSDESSTTVTVKEGADTGIECPIRTGPTDVVKWYKDAKLISEGNLNISNITRFNASSYACVVTNAVGSAYTTVSLNVEWSPVFRDGLGDKGERLRIKEGDKVEVVKGDDLYFDCGVDAKPAAKIKWIFNSRLLLNEDKDRLRLMNVQLHNSGTYKCVAQNAHGTLTRQFLLDVLEAPYISEFDYLEVQLKEGTNATLECNAKGFPTPEIIWVYNNTNWRLINSTLTTTNTSLASEGLFRCEATNEAGVARITYEVNVVVQARVKEIVVYLGGEGAEVENGVEVVLGSTARLSCVSTGNPTPSIQWIRNGNPLSRNIQGIAYADLVLDVKTGHSGVYSCVVANEGGMEERRVKLDVLEPPKISQSLFDSHPSKETKMEVIQGQAFYLHCHPYGNPAPQVYWFRDGLPLKLFDDTMISTDFGEMIVTNNAVYEQSGNYTCVAKNKVGEASVVYLVDVLVPPPTPKESTKAVNIRVGKPLELTCPVEGSPLPFVMWVKHPYTEINEKMARILLVNDNITLFINSTEVSDSGKYSCIMTNKVGTTEVVFDVTIEKPPSIAGNVGKNNIENRVVPLRRSVVLKCEADGHPLPKITWLKDTQQLSESLSNIQQVLDNSLLAIWSVSVRDAGQYICVASNNAGTSHRRYNIAVQVPGKWSAWSPWSLCNVTCGLGCQRRARGCQYIDDLNVTYDKTNHSDKVLLDDSACKGPSVDKRKCHMPICDEDSQMRWSSWSRWSRCSASCGAGTQARTRRCKTRTRCVGDNVQIKKCADLPPCENNPSDNEVYGSHEEITEMSPYMPEAMFEMQPEQVRSLPSSDVEELTVSSELKYSPVMFEVEVTSNLDRSDRGACSAGFRYNATEASCDDIDECLIDTNMCHSTQICLNTPGAYKCTCPQGYVSLGAGQRCLDVNECEQDIHRCQYACVNVAGGYVCACPKHSRLHSDKHHCISISAHREPTYEELEPGDYLTTAVEFPARYTKNSN